MKTKMRTKAVAAVAVVALLAVALFFTRGPELLAWADATGDPVTGTAAGEDAVSLSVPAASTTCNSCADCTAKLESGSWDTVILSTNISNYSGTCIGLIHGESNVTFDCGGHTIDGDDAAIDPDHGVTMMHGTGNTIQNCTISDFSNGIYLYDATSHIITSNTVSSNGTGIDLGFSDSNDINNNTISGNDVGIEISNSDNNDIDSNTVCDNDYRDFDMVSGTGNSGDDNTCDAPGSWNDDGTTGCTSICAGTTTCNSCADCTSKLNGTYSSVMLVQNIYGHSGTCITFGANNVEFDGNDHTIDGDDSGTDYGVYMNGRSGNTVKNCTINDFYHGIYLSGSSGNTVSWNTANSNTGDGISLNNSNGNTIAVFNEANSNGRYGMFLNLSNTNQVYFNEANYNDDVGIRLSNSDSNTVSFNDARDNNATDAWGMYLYGSDSNAISSNNLIGNYYGIKFDNSDSNVLNSNEVCSNPDIDFAQVGGSSGNSGDHNTCCADPDHWNDTGETGCTYQCDTAPDANDNGVSDACDCADARQGLNETGIDCGGICPVCRLVPTGWSNVAGVRLRGAPNSGLIDVVFVPEQSYSGNMTAFENAVIDNIAEWYLRLDEYVIDPIPANYKDRFNFYRYTGGFGTQTGCAGSLPSNFWSDAPGADVAAILAAPGSGAWGCASGLGPPGGHLRFIALGNRGDLVTHESGHAIFGLVDEYCGCTYYEQNSPTTNVWSSKANCQSDATAQGWTTGTCREIKCNTSCDGTPTEIKGWWRYDPDTPDADFMTCCPSGLTFEFGEACAWRMNWTFNNWPSGHSKGILVNFNIDDGVVSELSSEVVAGHPDIGLQKEDFLIQLRSEGGAVLQEYGIWDPRYELGAQGGPGMVYNDNVDFSMTFPYETGVQQVELREPDDVLPLVTVDFSPLDCTCDSCSDCQTKLQNPACATVRLTTDIIDHAGSCVSLIFGESNAMFDCDGHTIDGDDIAIDPDSGIALMHGTGNSVRNCVVSDFSRGIYLWDATEHDIVDNTLTSNGTGIELGWSDANEVTGNTVSENYTGVAIGNSNDNRIESNVVCENEVLDFNLTSGAGNSGVSNRCDNPDGWNDDGTTGCSSSCAAAGLYISPTVSTVGISRTTTIDVMVANVENLYGVQIEMDFDPSLVEVVDSNGVRPGVQIEEGDFFDPDITFSNQADNGAGIIQYVVSLQGVQPGVSGSGVLARIVLHGLEVGTSELGFIDAILSDSQSGEIPSDTDGGIIDVVESRGTLSGRVVLERRPGDAGASVCVDGQCVTTPEDGSYTLTGVSSEIHTLAVSRTSYLRSWRSVDVPVGELVVPDVVLLGGDIDQDDHIDDPDQNLLGQSWNSTPEDARWNPAADITDDDEVNILDWVAVQFNWGEAAPGAWASATDAERGLWPMWRLAAARGGARTGLGADVTAQVLVTPSHASLSGVGDAVALDIVVEGVSDLYSARVQLAYDPSVVQVQDADPGTSGVQIIPGDFLDPINRLEITEVSTETGEIDYSVSQRYPAEERTGSGLLATVVFEAVGLGTSPVDLVEVRLLDDTPLDPVEIPTSVQDGEVTVVGPVYLPLVVRNTGG